MMPFIAGLLPQEVKDLGYDIVLGNTFHLFLDPGDERIARFGGLHDFMGWDGPIVTDSGGFQVFSMGHGTVADEDRCRELAESSPSIVTPLNKYVGYENAAKLAKQSLKEKKTIRQVVLEGGYVERGDLTEQQLDEALDVLSMTRPPV